MEASALKVRKPLGFPGIQHALGFGPPLLVNQSTALLPKPSGQHEPTVGALRLLHTGLGIVVVMTREGHIGGR